jgi:hypothetical protein
MRKMPKPMQSIRFGKEFVASEDETEKICLEKVNPSVEEINSTINQLFKNPPPNACPSTIIGMCTCCRMKVLTPIG